MADYFKRSRRLPALIILSAGMVLGGCAGRPGPETLSTVKGPATPGVKQMSVLAMTTRARTDPAENAFSTKPSFTTNYASFEVTTPPDHKQGRIEWPRGKPNPDKTFAIRSQQVLDERSFYRTIANASPNREVGIFIHGYNTNFPEALYRLTQMSVDSRIDGVPVLFSWPSRGSVSGYVADKEAVTYSRDNLAAALVGVVEANHNRETVAFAHSMGGWLLMEALRQLKLEGENETLSRLKVVLAAPDIDANVFRTQLDVIGKMRTPITVLVSKDDRALKVSSILAIDSHRVGALDITDPAVVDASQRANVRIIDISNVKADDDFRHNRYAAMASTLPQLEKAEREKLSLTRAGAFVFDTAGATVGLPFRLARQIVNH